MKNSTQHVQNHPKKSSSAHLEKSQPSSGQSSPRSQVPTRKIPDCSPGSDSPPTLPSPAGSSSLSSNNAVPDYDDLLHRVTDALVRAKAANASHDRPEEDEAGPSFDDLLQRVMGTKGETRVKAFRDRSEVNEAFGEIDVDDCRHSDGAGERAGDGLEVDDDGEAPVKHQHRRVAFADRDEKYLGPEHLFDNDLDGDGIEDSDEELGDDEYMEDQDVAEDQFPTDQSPNRPTASKSKKKEKTSNVRSPNPKHVPKPKPVAKRTPNKADRKGKGKAVVTQEEPDEDDDFDDQDKVHDPEDPAYELNAENYPVKPGPIPNVCLKALNQATYDYTTKVYALARQFGKRPQELFEASSQSYTSKHQPSTWNCFQAYLCMEKGWRKDPNETREEFVQRLATAYETKLKKALGDEWQRQKVQQQVVLDHQKKGGSTLRELNKAVKELNKVQRVIYDAFGFVVMSEIHDLNNHSRSKFTGHGPEYRRVMETQNMAFTKLLKLHSAQLVVARNKEEQDGMQELDEDIVQIIHLYDSDPKDLTNLRSLMPKALGVDLKLATDGACSKMRWKVFSSIARTNHVRMKNWPVGLPAIGPKADGLIENVKSFNKSNLVEWMDSRARYWKAHAKSEDDRTEADEAILEDGFKGPFVEAWTDEEVNGTVDKGDIPLIVNEEGNAVLCVRDILKDNTQNDSDDEPEEHSRGRKKPVPAATSSSKHRPPVRTIQDDSDDDQAAPVSHRHPKNATPAQNDSLPDNDEEDFVPPRQQRQDDSDDSDYITLPKPLRMNKGKHPLSSRPPASQTTTARPAKLPPKLGSLSNRVITNAGSIVTKFVEENRPRGNAAAGSSRSGSSRNMKRKGDGNDEGRPNKKQKGSGSKSYKREELKKIHRQ
ncbi:hypothetical protein VKT23_019320 [Stygiomarasmius scandens]|uniref:Uncharacterized protein n=1 Tax=Marasmiellus scandens TaxID=2682957 RepID=A0ABR1IP68_9AGAR